jgi:hypothetical protein
MAVRLLLLVPLLLVPFLNPTSARPAQSRPSTASADTAGVARLDCDAALTSGSMAADALRSGDAVRAPFKPVRATGADRSLSCLFGITYFPFSSAPEELASVLRGHSGAAASAQPAARSGPLLSYQFGGGEEYSEGDVVGYSITIQPTGRYRLRERVYVGSGASPPVESRELDEGRLDEPTLDSLRTALRRFAATSPPSRFPDADPSEAKLEGPARSLKVEMRPDPAQDPLSVRAHMGADARFYSDEFMTLIQFLDDLVYSRI